MKGTREFETAFWGRLTQKIGTPLFTSQSPSVVSLCFPKASLAFGEASHCMQWREKPEEHQIHFARLFRFRQARRKSDTVIY